VLDRVVEFAGAGVGSVVGGDLAQLPAGGSELASDAVQQLTVWRERGLRSEVCTAPASLARKCFSPVAGVS
jgi:hypothetical protein